MSLDLTAGIADSVVLCTGSGGAIGRAVCAGLEQAGAQLIVVDRTAELARSGVADHERVLALGVDLADTEQPSRLVRTALEQFGRLDAVVDLAAVIRRVDDLEAITADDIELQLATNLRAPLHLCQAAAAAMQPGGRIVLFASQGAFTGGFGGSLVYSAAKGGIVSMSRGLARTLGPRGIRVNVVAPGLVDTPMLRDGLDRQRLSALVEGVPLGRLATPQDIVGPVLFLLSDHSAYLTGTTLNVSGGLLMH